MHLLSKPRDGPWPRPVPPTDRFRGRAGAGEEPERQPSPLAQRSIESEAARRFEYHESEHSGVKMPKPATAHIDDAELKMKKLAAPEEMERRRLIAVQLHALMGRSMTE